MPTRQPIFKNIPAHARQAVTRAHIRVSSIKCPHYLNSKLIFINIISQLVTELRDRLQAVETVHPLCCQSALSCFPEGRWISNWNERRFLARAQQRHQAGLTPLGGSLVRTLHGNTSEMCTPPSKSWLRALRLV